jgi:hypothetical protein
MPEWAVRHPPQAMGFVHLEFGAVEYCKDQVVDKQLAARANVDRCCRLVHGGIRNW